MSEHLELELQVECSEKALEVVVIVKGYPWTSEAVGRSERLAVTAVARAVSTQETYWDSWGKCMVGT